MSFNEFTEQLKTTASILFGWTNVHDRVQAIIENLSVHPKGLPLLQEIYRRRKTLKSERQIKSMLSSGLESRGYWDPETKVMTHFEDRRKDGTTSHDPSSIEETIQSNEQALDALSKVIRSVLMRIDFDSADNTPKKRIPKKRPATHREKIILKHLDRKGSDYAAALDAADLDTPPEWQCPHSHDQVESALSLLSTPDRTGSGSPFANRAATLRSSS